MSQRRNGLRPGVLGVVSVLLGAGLGEVVAAFLLPGSSPFAAVGGALIDIAPSWAKDTAIAWFGTGDKVALLIGIAVVLLAVAFGAGMLERRRTPVGALLFAALGTIGAVIAVVRSDGAVFAAIPALLAGGAAALTVRALVPLGEREEEPERRRFLIWTAVATASGLLALAVSNVARSATQSVQALRDAIRLPVAQSPAAPVPAAAELGIPGLAPVVTPKGSFYRIDTALIVPQVDPSTWSLRVHGMVDREVVLTWEELLSSPLTEADVTLACVSNTVGGDLIGNARWLGLPVRELLARAGVDPDADMVLSTSIDGFTASTPLEALTDDRDALLAIGMNGEPLPVEHGFPVRLVVPGLYGYVSATKWVTELEVTRFDRATAYWTTRGWSERGPIKLQSRIDVPRGSIDAGDTVIAGMAWQQHVGVRGVEVRVDGGPWQAATLAAAISDDTWVQWRLPWTADSGSHDIECRAVGADGVTQTEAAAPPAPDGATGWHRISVTVR